MSSTRGDGDPFSVEHRLRRLQSQQAHVPERRARPRVFRELTVIGGVVIVTILLWPFGQVETADYPEARVLADRIQAVVLPVWRGEVSIEEAPIPDDLRLYELDVGGRTTWIVTHAQPTAHGTCYGLRSGGGLVSAAVRFAPTDGCMPQATVGFEASGSWGEVLPREQVTPLWFIPVISVLGAAALAALVRIVTRLLFR